MKREEIENFPAGDELDALVAEKIMNWHISTSPEGYKYWETFDNHWAAGMNQNYGNFEDSEDFHLLHWHPSQSILWAMDVVEEMQRRGYWSYLSIMSSYCRTNFVFPDTNASFEMNAEINHLPLAICRAALYAICGE